SYDSDFVQALDDYMFNGNPDELSFDFNTEENKRDGNTIYIDKKLISGLISTHNGVIGDINQMAVLTAKIGHEYKHDGENNVSQENAKKGQEFLAEDPSMSEEDLTNKLIGEGYTEEEAANIAGEIFEDIDANIFETSIWGGLKQTFGVKDESLDAKLVILNVLDKENFVKYLTQNYNLGQEKEEEKGKTIFGKIQDFIVNNFMEMKNDVLVWKDSIIEKKIVEWQEKIDSLEEKAKKGDPKAFTWKDKLFLTFLYNGLIPAGGIMEGYNAAADLMYRYMTPSKKAGDNESNYFIIDSEMYQNSTIVQYAMNKMKEAIAQDAKDGKLDEYAQFGSVGFLDNKRFGDAGKNGEIKDNGILLTEQDNKELFYTNNQFQLQCKNEIQEDGTIKTTWYVEDYYDFEPYPSNYYTELPFNREKGFVLKIEDGLSSFLTILGLVEAFYYKAFWEEIWNIEDYLSQ
ncbi:MAG: hypothetical protein GYA51_17515, partial [Candidatus Methanofastidiosa archaeon]|nr:hypothetical protein [Candidatus Methanofastidiosa archaeon]